MADDEARLLTTEEAARYVALSRSTLEKMRVTGGGPRFFKNPHAVRYRRADLDAWISSKVVGSTSELAAA